MNDDQAIAFGLHLEIKGSTAPIRSNSATELAEQLYQSSPFGCLALPLTAISPLIPINTVSPFEARPNS